MFLGRASQAWNALYDNLQLTTELEQKIVTWASAPFSINGFCTDTKHLLGATLSEVSDYFRERRDYIESVATLDLVIATERAIREDLEARRGGFKSSTSPAGISLVGVPNAPGQQYPAARRLLSEWTNTTNADTQLLETLDQGMQYRNWLVHGNSGHPPYLLNPFILDTALEHLLALISGEP
jgi:hypothetical protein